MAGQILAFAGIAVINVLLPGLVKRDFPRRVALMTGLVSLRAPSAQAVAGLSGMAQGVGYLLASAGPLLTGLLYNAFGRGAVAALCIGISAAALLFGIGAGRSGHVQAPNGTVSHPVQERPPGIAR